MQKDIRSPVDEGTCDQAVMAVNSHRSAVANAVELRRVAHAYSTN